MKHCFKPVPSCTQKGLLFAECSISGHRARDLKTAEPRQFKTAEEVDTFSRRHIGNKLDPQLFKECANALLVRHGAIMLCEDPCESGSQKTFRIDTRFGPAQVTPVDTWVIFRFLEPEGKNFPMGMSRKSGSWNFYSNEGDLSALLEDFADGLAQTTAPVAIKIASESRCEVLPACVMKSAAGYYVGSYCRTEEGDYPHSRYSDYFRSSKKAEHWLTTSLENGSL